MAPQRLSHTGMLAPSIPLRMPSGPLYQPRMDTSSSTLLQVPRGGSHPTVAVVSTLEPDAASSTDRRVEGRGSHQGYPESSLGLRRQSGVPVPVAITGLEIRLCPAAPGDPFCSSRPGVSERQRQAPAGPTGH